MKKTKRATLEAHGWRFGTAGEFLNLTPAVARRLKSSQSRVAKMEAAEPAVSIDLCCFIGYAARSACPAETPRWRS